MMMFSIIDVCIRNPKQKAEIPNISVMEVGTLMEAGQTETTERRYAVALPVCKVIFFEKSQKNQEKA